MVFAWLRQILTLAITTSVLVCSALAFIDAIRHSNTVFVREGKKTKKFWLIVLGVALFFSLLGFANMVGIFLTLMAIAPAAIYWYDVRPELKHDTGNPYKVAPKSEKVNQFWSNYRGY